MSVSVFARLGAPRAAIYIMSIASILLSSCQTVSPEPIAVLNAADAPPVMLQRAPDPAPEKPASETSKTVSIAANTTAPLVYAPPDPRGIPADLKGLTELIDERTDRSATFKNPNGGFTSILSAESMHYLDSRGRWQVIDPSFQPAENGYVVEQNSIRSKVGQTKATIAAVAGSTALNWQTTEIGITRGVSYTTVASALGNTSTPAEIRDDGRTLHYAGAWSDAAIAEEITSAPDQLEQALVLEKAPVGLQNAMPDASQDASATAYLDIKATLKMLPNTFLWADGRLQTGDFHTRGAIELRSGAMGAAGTANQVAARFEPAVVFEQKDHDQTVSAEYIVTSAPVGNWTPQPNSGPAPQIWTVTIRTPLAWWQDQRRRYPVVIDPTVRVLQSTGNGTGGLAWVGAGSLYPGFVSCRQQICDTQDNNLRYGAMLIGSEFIAPIYKGYLQFNQMPWLMARNPISVSSAILEMQPSGLIMPGYKFGDDPGWAENKTQKDVHLYGLPCPDLCNGFTLTQTMNTWNWGNTPAPGGASQVNFGVAQVSAPAYKGPNKGVPGLPGKWDVTNFVRSWVQKTPRPADGPMFMAQAVGVPCLIHGDDAANDPNGVVFSEDDNSAIPSCTRVIVWPNDVRLRISYDAMTLNVGQNLVNKPGLPSYNKGVFDNGSGGDMVHQYALAPNANGTHWRGVAVRPNSDLAPASQGQTGIGLNMYSNPADDNTAVELGRDMGSANVSDDTEFVFIDDYNQTFPAVASAALKVNIPSSKTGNDYPTDGDRNYRIHYTIAGGWNISYSTPTTQVMFFNSGSLLQMSEFPLIHGDNVLISITVPSTVSLDLALVNPTSYNSATTKDAVRSKSNQAGMITSQGFHKRVTATGVSYSYVASFLPDDGVYMLAFINKGRPTRDPFRPTEAQSFPVTVNIYRCPFGTIATARYGCQPILAPQPATPKNTALGLDVYSEGGFAAITGGWCTKGESAGTPIIGPSTQNRWVSVAQGSVCFDGQTLSTTIESGVLMITQTSVFTQDARIHGVGPFGFSYGTTALYPLLSGEPTGVVTRTVASAPLNLLQPTTSTLRNVDPFKQNWASVTTHLFDQISMADVKMYGSDIITTPVAIDSSALPTVTSWLIPWNIYADEATDPHLLYTFNYHMTQAPLFPTPMNLSSMGLRILGPTANAVTILDSDKQGNGPEANQFRASQAKITQPAKLGGASQNVEALVLPPGFSRYSPPNDLVNANCGPGESCLDIYDAGYVWKGAVTPWVLPDVHVTDAAKTVMMNSPGHLNIFSADHPASHAPAAPADVNESFSFDTFSVKVSIRESICYAGGPKVTIIHGEGFIALPIIGGDGSDGASGPPSVSVDFTLCDSKLHEASLSLNIHPADIPVGSSGLGVYMIGGQIVVNPDYTVVTFTLGFETMDKELLTGGEGDVIIDTRGMFELFAKATIISVIDVSLTLQIAWNPLDVLLDAEASCCGGWITGRVMLEGWIGQGWQHKYKWLPDNNKFHFAGEISAYLKIPKGDISSFLDLPPFNFELGLKVAFGEFCANDKCSDTTSGMSIVLDIMSINIGLFVDKHGPAFILGSDSHVLINEYQGQSQLLMMSPVGSLAQDASSASSPSRWLLPQGLTFTFPITVLGGLQLLLKPTFNTPVDDWQPVTSGNACTAGNHTITCPFTLSQSAGRAMFLTHWLNGDLKVSLIRPDNTVITVANASSYNVTVTQVISPLFKELAYAVHPTSTGQSLIAGVWKLKLDNVGIFANPAITRNNWSLLFFSDAAAPTLTWNSPVTMGVTPDGNGDVALQWSAARAGMPLTPSTRLELFFTPVVSKPLDSNEMAGTLIVGQYTATLGSYVWNTGGLKSGEYAVGARIDDHLHGNGAVVFWAPGSVVINDTTPPPAPTLLGTKTQANGLVVIWKKDMTPDLSGYLVDYNIYDWDESTILTRTRRVLAHSWNISPTFELPVERVRLGGMLTSLYNGATPTTTVCLRSYDASGNISLPSCNTITVTLPGGATLFPVRRIAAQMLDIGALAPLLGARVSYAPSDAPGAVGYLLSYRPIGCILPNVKTLADQGPSAIDIGNPLSHTFTLTGLTIGQRYEYGINPYDAIGNVGPGVTVDAVFVNPADANTNGLPDQWEALYGVSDPNADPDHDGLTNLQEYLFGTDPNNAYSGGGKHSDGEVMAAGLQACSPLDPGPHQTPKLTLVGDNTAKFTVAINSTNAPSQTIKIINTGADILDWMATPSDAWIVLDKTSGGLMDGSVKIGVNPNGLPPGHYKGKVTLNNTYVVPPPPALAANSPSAAALAPGDIITETAEVAVELNVLPAKEFTLYMPIASK